MIYFKDDKFEKLYLWFLKISFVLLTLPRSIKSVSIMAYNSINILKIAIILMMIAIIFYKKIKITKFTKIFIAFMLYLLIVTMINDHSPVYLIKVYIFNLGMLLLSEMIFKSPKRNEIISFCANYLLIALAINFIDIILKKTLYIGFRAYYKTYVLGMDNRFILYIIAALLCSYCLFTFDKKNKWLLYTTYIIGVLSLLFVWSVAAVCVALFMGLAYMIVNRKNIRINPYIVLIIILIIGILIPFFKIHYLFKFIIVNILHKPLNLNYRVDVWNVAIDYIFKNPMKLYYGFGFWNLTAAKYMPYALRISHLHNITLNLLFCGGFVGTIIYMKNIFGICGTTNNIENNLKKNIMIIAFSSIMILMIFDTFELYSIYYFILFMLYQSASIYNDDGPVVDNKTTENMVSIVCCTYNQKEYIEKCINSLLEQKTSFNYEILIHDDASTDGTLKILKKYEKKKNIKVIYEKENQYSKGVNIFALMLKECNGKYIALCEGDDYWIDKNKLQKQYNFMEKHSDCSLITTDAKVFNEIDQKFYIRKKPYNHSRYFSTKEVIMYDGDLFPTCSMFFINNGLKLPKFYKVAPVGDYPLTIYLSLIGKVYYYNDCTAVYRKNAKGSWTMAMKDQGYINSKKNMIVQLGKMFDQINKETSNKYKEYTKYVILKRKFEIALLCRDSIELKNKEYRKLYKKGNLKKRIKFFIKVRFSNLFLIIKRI